MIRYRCTKCGAELESPASLAGKHEKCPECARIVDVPTPPKTEKAMDPLVAQFKAAVANAVTTHQAAATTPEEIVALSSREVQDKMDFLLFKGDQNKLIVDHIVEDIKKLQPGRVLIVGSGDLSGPVWIGEILRGGVEYLIDQLKAETNQYRLYQHKEPSLSWLCRAAKTIRSKGEPAIILSNYPRQSESPTSHVVSYPDGVHRTVQAQAGASLQLCQSSDKATLVAIYVIGVYAMGYYESVFRSQAISNDNLPRFYVLAPHANFTMTDIERSQLEVCSTEEETDLLLRDIAIKLETDPNCPQVARAGAILIE